MKPSISIIISTFGRYDEVNLLLQSLLNQKCDLALFEIIIIDQNDKIDLSQIVIKYVDSLNLVHHKTNIKGLSKAKNTGILLSRADIVTFSDDDCILQKDTLFRNW